MSDAKRAARAFGLRAETLAAFWLRAQWFRILDRNYRVQGGEIDIVAQRGHLIVFVEVKARADLETAALAIPRRNSVASSAPLIIGWRVIPARQTAPCAPMRS